MTTPVLPPIRETVAVTNPNAPQQYLAPNADGSIDVAGTSASGVADDASNPVKVGAVFNTTPPTYTNGVRGTLQLTSDGSVRSFLVGSSSTAKTSIGTATAFAYPNGSNTGGLPVATNPFLWNGSSMDAGVTIDGALAAGSAGTGTVAVEHGGFSFAEITTATSTTVKSSPGILHRVCINTPVASATIKIYNATSATGTPITITCGSGASNNPYYIDYDMYFSTGIFVVTSGATDVTIGYR